MELLRANSDNSIFLFSVEYIQVIETLEEACFSLQWTPELAAQRKALNSTSLQDTVVLPYIPNFIAAILTLRCKVCRDRLGANHSAYLDKSSVSTVRG